MLTSTHRFLDINYYLLMCTNSHECQCPEIAFTCKIYCDGSWKNYILYLTDLTNYHIVKNLIYFPNVDESTNISLVDLSKDMTNLTLIDTHYPVYKVLMRFWIIRWMKQLLAVSIICAWRIIPQNLSGMAPQVNQALLEIHGLRSIDRLGVFKRNVYQFATPSKSRGLLLL